MGYETVTFMHNDGVVQGLSETSFMPRRDPLGRAAIGTGLGNARFTNRTHPLKIDGAPQRRQ